MSEAIKLAYKAYELQEIPVGALIVKENKIIGCGYNQKEKTKNPLKHAELIAIEEACKNIGDWRLNKCILYVTLKPCKMCMGAIEEARIEKVIYGANRELKEEENNKVVQIGGILEEECLKIIQNFFKNRRNK